MPAPAGRLESFFGPAKVVSSTTGKRPAPAPAGTRPFLFRLLYVTLLLSLLLLLPLLLLWLLPAMSGVPTARRRAVAASLPVARVVGAAG